MIRASDQIGVEEIRRQVNAAIIDIETLAISSERPAEEKQPTVRELTALVRAKLDADTLTRRADTLRQTRSAVATEPAQQDQIEKQ